ncbi:alpha/beta fold hydrolase [Paraburkholderia sp. MM5482-R1]|uniref:alpha/beta fold hydrolase n=1 Tax=Paraburkholderia sp. MM5482-R1 TaxID=2991063 RepID=UPI003D1FD8D7
MIVTVQGKPAYAYTGGKPFDASLPTAVFIHGAEHDHSVWALQSRYFAHHGFGVLAVDLPGHRRSAGPALASIAALADWLAALLDAVGVTRAFVAGHSMGLADRARLRRPLSAARNASCAARHRAADDGLRRAARRRAQSRARGNRHGQPVVAFDARREALVPRPRFLAARHEPAADGARVRRGRAASVPHRLHRLPYLCGRPRSRGAGALRHAPDRWPARCDDAAARGESACRCARAGGHAGRHRHARCGPRVDDRATRRDARCALWLRFAAAA